MGCITEGVIEKFGLDTPIPGELFLHNLTQLDHLLLHYEADKKKAEYGIPPNQPVSYEVVACWYDGEINTEGELQDYQYKPGWWRYEPSNIQPYYEPGVVYPHQRSRDR